MTCRKTPRANNDELLSPITKAARHGKPVDLGGMTAIA